MFHSRNWTPWESAEMYLPGLPVGKTLYRPRAAFSNADRPAMEIYIKLLKIIKIYRPVICAQKWGSSTGIAITWPHLKWHLTRPGQLCSIMPKKLLELGRHGFTWDRLALFSLDWFASLILVYCQWKIEPIGSLGPWCEDRREGDWGKIVVVNYKDGIEETGEMERLDKRTDGVKGRD